MTELYHCAVLPLGAGSIICPGNWGRIKRRFEKDGASLLRESVLEDIRKREFPSKPSRLDCAFGCQTEAHARAYRDRHAPTSLIYRVALVEPKAPTHLGDFELVIRGFAGLNGIEEIARAYWKGGASSPSVEILTSSPLRIIACVDTISPALNGLAEAEKVSQAG